MVADSRRDGSTKPASITDRNPSWEEGWGWSQDRNMLETQTNFTSVLGANVGATNGGGADGLVPVVVMNQRSNQMWVWPSGGGASLALSRVAALVGAGAST